MTNGVHGVWPDLLVGLTEEEQQKLRDMADAERLEDWQPQADFLELLVRRVRGDINATQVMNALAHSGAEEDAWLRSEPR